MLPTLPLIEKESIKTEQENSLLNERTEENRNLVIYIGIKQKS